MEAPVCVQANGILERLDAEGSIWCARNNNCSRANNNLALFFHAALYLPMSALSYSTKEGAGLRRSLGVYS